jgi:hypothetical protein
LNGDIPDSENQLNAISSFELSIEYTKITPSHNGKLFFKKGIMAIINTRAFPINNVGFMLIFLIFDKILYF